ncbi:MAG: electron transfer flavoprotein subunit alpha/FixB family protein [Desulfosudaceae bacterium]
MTTDILLITETVDNNITGTSLELAGLAEALQAAAGAGRAVFLAAGGDNREKAEKLAGRTGLEVCLLEAPEPPLPNPESLATAVIRMARETGCRFICFPHTSSGCQAAAKTAVALSAPCVAGVDQVAYEADDEAGKMIWRSALFNGKIALETATSQTPLVITVLPGAFAYDPAERDQPTAGKLTTGPALEETPAYRPLELTRAVETDTAIDQADILVAAGRGLGEADNLALVEDLARLLPNAAVAASRPLCDLNWLPYSRQVGATGKTVSPRLYLACGISGAQQHVYGMKDSQWIVAINTDPRAAIFSVADYCVVEDVTTFLPLLTEIYQNQK